MRAKKMQVGQRLHYEDWQNFVLLKSLLHAGDDEVQRWFNRGVQTALKHKRLMTKTGELTPVAKKLRKVAVEAELERKEIWAKSREETQRGKSNRA